ncbi:MAG: hypothetical protein JNM83_12595 [Myxococcales bacterium]|nr:hypothetical protein [Myxococcales bacterium]
MKIHQMLRQRLTPKPGGLFLLFLFAWLSALPCFAVPVPATRTAISADKAATLGPLLRHSDLVLLESLPSGQMKQITIMAWVAAPPALTREVVIHPEYYKDFVRNMTKSQVQHNPDGTYDHQYEFSYPITTVGGTTRFLLHKPEPGQAAGAVDLFDPEPGGTRWHRWEFVPYAGGTIVVLSGYTDVLHSGYPIDRLIQRVPTLEYGLSMIGQMTPLLTFKARAEQLATGFQPQPVPPTGEASYGFLLDKGVVVLLRKNQGRLAELTLISEPSVRKEALLRSLSEPASWSSCVPSITKSRSLGSPDGIALVELEQSIPLLSFVTQFGVRLSDSSVDMMGFSGDLRGARMRFDVRPSGGQRLQLIFKSSVAYDRGSLLIRQLYKLEPLFEYGVNLGLSLVFVRGLTAQANK